MTIKYLPEPELQFGYGKSVCPREGISNYSPYDINKNSRPDKIKLGIIGRSDSVEKVIEWLNKSEDFIQRKTSNKNQKPKLFPSFCGFKIDEGFRSKIVFDDDYIRKINISEFDQVIKSNENLEKRIEEIAHLFLEEIRFLSKNKKPDVIICVVTEKFISAITEGTVAEIDDEDIVDDEIDEEEVIEKENNFRRYLKAKAMQYHIPIQIVRDRIVKPTAEMQDIATIAWNFYTALYYKASGTPWAMIKNSNDIVCFAGISFYKSRDKSTTQTSVAQIFDELGKGVILRGEPVGMKKSDLVPHLTDEQAYRLIYKSLAEYKEAVKTVPQRLVIHKTSNFYDGEVEGIKQAAKEFQINALDLVTIMDNTSLRLFRKHGSYPPMRGTLLSLTDENHLLYTRGSIPFYQTYTGKYIPQPLEIRINFNDESPDIICSEILALTKMNWNNTQFDRKLPITIECSRNVGEILKYLTDDDKMELKYSFYM